MATCERLQSGHRRKFAQVKYGIRNIPSWARLFFLNLTSCHRYCSLLSGQTLAHTSTVTLKGLGECRDHKTFDTRPRPGAAAASPRLCAAETRSSRGLANELS